MTPKLIITLTLFLWGYPIAAQNPFRVMFYNVENLFDIVHESGKEDKEFTPNGYRHWNNKRYYTKLNNLAKVITVLGGWDTPVLIGLCEVENDKVVRDLTTYSPLRNLQYRYVITESEDERGINVALLYQRDRFKYLYHNCIRVSFPYNPQKRTRDVLHVTGQIITGDTLDVFVCHFPSRRNGQAISEPDRIRTATIVRSVIDSLKNCRPHANILVMGDFNDEPSDKSLEQVLVKDDLYNLFFSVYQHSHIGTYKFAGEWNFLDQIIISTHLLDQQQSFHVLPETARIFQAGFLLIDDRTNGGKRPKKTFHGYRYEGGYSDHLPVFVDFSVK